MEIVLGIIMGLLFGNLYYAYKITKMVATKTEIGVLNRNILQIWNKVQTLENNASLERIKEVLVIPESGGNGSGPVKEISLYEALNQVVKTVTEAKPLVKVVAAEVIPPTTISPKTNKQRERTPEEKKAWATRMVALRKSKKDQQDAQIDADMPPETEEANVET
jgi:hypothetical protein